MREGLFFASAKQPIPRLRLPELSYRLEIQMGGRIDTILMCVKFGNDPVSSLDFSFIGGGCTLK